jgi:adenosylcobinamide kinase / adenosylcobinamide-phosphate guanylyltransferase
MKTLILGGVRSGKSRLAERMAAETKRPVIYIATATALDAEMQTRIETHREHRPENWQVVEEPIQLAATLNLHSKNNSCVLIDCLTLWLTNLLMLEDKTVYEKEREALLQTLPTLQGDIIMVSNETNMGVMPLGDLSRVYCDEAGRLHQQLAEMCDRAILTVAGLPQILKGEPL